jgi:hypothetical protein
MLVIFKQLRPEFLNNVHAFIQRYFSEWRLQKYKGL